MLTSEIKDPVITPELMLEKLKFEVSLRDKMGGALYYNVQNEECCRIANKCIEMGCNRAEIESILGPGTFY